MQPQETPLDVRTQELLARAERRVPAREANQEIDRERTRQELAYGRALSYEVVLSSGKGFAYLATVVAPQLTAYLVSKKLSPHACRGVFLSLFVEDTLYFVEAAQFFEAVRAAEGLDDAAWRRLLRTWEARG